MRMMIVRMEMRGGLRTAVVWDGASDMLELNGGVPNVELVAEDLVDAAQDRLRLRGRHVLDQHVRA